MAGGAAGHGHRPDRLRGPRPGHHGQRWWPTSSTALILTLDLGTSTIKAVVWDADGPRGRGPGRPWRRSIPRRGRAEQDPDAGGRPWWRPAPRPGPPPRRPSPPSRPSASPPPGRPSCRVTAAGEPLGPGSALVRPPGRGRGAAAGRRPRWGRRPSEPHRRRPIDGASMAAKVAWLAGHEPERLAAEPLAPHPRDLLVFRHDRGRATDPTMASAAGPLDLDRPAVAELVAGFGHRLPRSSPPGRWSAPARPAPAAALSLRAGVPVVVGAGDRACEVLGTGRLPRPAHGDLGDDGQRLGPRADRLPRPRPRGRDRQPGGRRRLAPRGRPLGRRAPF